MLGQVLPRTTAIIAALGIAVAMLAACASPATTTTPAQAPDPLKRFYEQKLSWGPCADYATSDDDRATFAEPKFECARLEVPLDYAAPEGPTAKIAVLRQKASGNKIGSLVFNPGGPGSSGNSLVASLAPGLRESPLSQRFDLVGFDPRGVGASTPTIDCIDDAEWEAERADLDVDPSPAGVEQTEKENKEFAQECAERSGGPQVLATVGTREVVKDLDILRAALGDQKLNYVGYSYGTRIGSAYAEEFPQNVRALVLDGAIDPKESSFDRSINQSAGFQHAFDAFAADCARQPNCPLGTDPAKASAAFQALTRPLIDKPAAAEGGKRKLSYTDAVTGTIQALYLSQLWPSLARGISALANGDGTPLMRLADIYYDRERSGHYGNSIEAFNVISCVDEERITDRAVQGEMLRRSDEVSPFKDTGRGTVAALDWCAFWPVPPTSKPHVPQVAGLPRTLVISTTGDPATPYQAGVEMAKALNASLLTYEGEQHTVALRGVQCVDSIVDQYLVDLKLPDGDARCRLE
jgi:pimeloyl-ACP methyl ester carboxylesterase